MPTPEQKEPTVEVSFRRELKDKGGVVICACRGNLKDLFECQRLVLEIEARLQAVRQNKPVEDGERSWMGNTASPDESTQSARSVTGDTSYLRRMTVCAMQGKEDLEMISKANRKK